MEVHNMNAIEVNNVSFRYPIGKQNVLENISFTIKKGEFVAIVGVNGGGKTTLCNILRGFIPSFHNGCEFNGSVIVEGENIANMTMGKLAKKIGFVFQNPFIQISGIKKTVFEEVAFGLENLGTPRDEMKSRVEEIIKLLKIDNLKDKHPAELSGGQRQRVALASVLIMEPDILIIDEPTSQLDPLGTEEVFEIINIMKEKNKTIILVEHKIDLISEYADRVILLNDKKIVLDDTVENVLTNESILKHGIKLPRVTQLAITYEKEKNKKLEYIPVSIDSAIKLFKKHI